MTQTIEQIQSRLLAEANADKSKTVTLSARHYILLVNELHYLVAQADTELASFGPAPQTTPGPQRVKYRRRLDRRAALSALLGQLDPGSKVRNPDPRDL
jgi:hypothetical protein